MWELSHTSYYSLAVCGSHSLTHSDCSLWESYMDTFRLQSVCGSHSWTHSDCSLGVIHGHLLIAVCLWESFMDTFWLQSVCGSHTWTPSDCSLFVGVIYGHLLIHNSIPWLLYYTFIQVIIWKKLHQIFGTRVQRVTQIWTQSDLRFCENNGSKDFKSMKKGSFGSKIKGTFIQNA